MLRMFESVKLSVSRDWESATGTKDFQGNPTVPNAMPANEVLDREFLEIRAKVLELAASFDRLERGEGLVTADPRYQLIQDGIKILQERQDGRAERVQLLFSQPFEADWRKQYGI